MKRAFPHIIKYSSKTGCFLKSLNVELICDPAVPLLAIYPREPKTYFHMTTSTRMFIAALFKTAKKQKQPKCPSRDEWMGKVQHTHIMEYYLVM